MSLAYSTVSSNLAEADRLDVRSEIAAAACVSTGNVGKVKQLVLAAHPDVLEALRAGEVSIHKASVWLRKRDKQLDVLGVHQNRRGITKIVNSRLRAYRRDGWSELLDAPHIAEAPGRLSSEQSGTILVAEVKVLLALPWTLSDLASISVPWCATRSAPQ